MLVLFAVAPYAGASDNLDPMLVPWPNCGPNSDTKQPCEEKLNTQNNTEGRVENISEQEMKDISNRKEIEENRNTDQVPISDSGGNE